MGGAKKNHVIQVRHCHRLRHRHCRLRRRRGYHRGKQPRAHSDFSPPPTHLQQALQSYASPPGPNEVICRAQGSRGGNKVDVMLPDGFQALVILPARFRKQIWIRNGGFLIVEVIEDAERGGERVFNGEIVRVLLKDDEKHLRGLDGGVWWPERWSVREEAEAEEGEGEEEEEAEGEEDEGEDRSSSSDELPEYLQRVSNRRRVPYQDDSDESEDSD